MGKNLVSINDAIEYVVTNPNLVKADKYGWDMMHQIIDIKLSCSDKKYLQIRIDNPRDMVIADIVDLENKFTNIDYYQGISTETIIELVREFPYCDIDSKVWEMNIAYYD